MGADQPLTLNNWLATATRGIASWDQERIEREIRAHYDDAVNDGLGQGLSQDDAERVALESLGSAKKARRENRKTCSSAGTEKMLETLVECHPRKGKFIWGREHWTTALLLIGICLAYFVASSSKDGLSALASTTIIIPIVLILYLMFVAIPNFVDRGMLKKAYIARHLLPFMYLIGVMLPNLSDYALNWSIITHIWLLGLFVWYYEVQKELRKIPKNLSRDDLLKG